MKYCCREYFWRDRQPCLKEQSDAQACVRLSTLFFLFARVYRSGQQQFLNANFVWNQDEVSQNSRYAKRFYYSRQLSAQTMQHLAVRVKPISFALRACFLGHYRMARMSQSASPCGLASWMRPQMIPDTHLLKLLFLARYYPSLNLLAFLSISVVLRTCFLDLHCCNILLRRTCFPSFP